MPRDGHLPRVQYLLDRLDAYGDEAAEALAYLRQHRTKVSVHAQPTGARWTIRRSIELHPRYAAADADQLYAISLIIHEVRHLQQGPLTALSVYGEMDAWQLQFGFLRRLTGRYHDEPSRDQIIQQLVALPLGWDRGVLQQARELMQAFAGKRYRVDLLPLYPLPSEIRFSVLRSVPRIDRTK